MLLEVRKGKRILTILPIKCWLVFTNMGQALCAQLTSRCGQIPWLFFTTEVKFALCEHLQGGWISLAKWLSPCFVWTPKRWLDFLGKIVKPLLCVNTYKVVVISLVKWFSHCFVFTRSWVQIQAMTSGSQMHFLEISGGHWLSYGFHALSQCSWQRACCYVQRGCVPMGHLK